MNPVNSEQPTEPPAADGPWIVTKAEFSRLMNVSKPMVSKWIAESRLGAGARGDGRIDVAIACRSLGRPIPTRGVAIAADLMSGARPMVMTPPPADPPDDGEPDELLQSRIASARMKVEREQLDLDERRGRLVDRAAVEAAVEGKARRLRDAIMAVPGDVADQCVGLDASRIEQIMATRLERAINEQLTEGS